MAQIIRHRRGVLESVTSAAKRKAELMIITGSSGITSTNSDAMIFFGDGIDATPANKILYGTTTPDLQGDSYSTAVDGIPYYNTSEEKLYILAKGGNTEVKATANTGGTNIVSGSTDTTTVDISIADGIISANVIGNVYSSSEQVANDILSDNRSIDLGTGNLDANGITADGSLNVTGLTNVGIISGSSLDLTGNANIAGNITLGGNITIGDASSDTIAFGGDLSTDIIPNANNTLDLGSSTDKFAEVHATNLYGELTGTVNGTVNATNGVISSSLDTDSITITRANGVISADVVVAGIRGGVISGSDQVIAHLPAGTISGSIQVIDDINAVGVISGSDQLLNQATDFGTGRVSGDDFGDADGGSTFTGSFEGDGSGLTGLATNLIISGGTGDDEVDLLSNALTFSGTTNEIVTAVTDNEVTISLPDDVTIGRNLTVVGNLDVQGTTTTIDSTTIDLGDNIIELNGSGATNGGLLVKDVTAPNTVSGSLLWDSTNDYWKAGALGAESKLLREDGDGIISQSQQVEIDDVNGFTTFSSSVDSRIVDLDSNLDSTIKTKLNTETVVSGSDQVIAHLPAGTVSGSDQTIANLPAGVISGSAITTDGVDLVAIGTAAANVGDLASGNQLSLYGASTTSGLTSFDVGGTAKSFDYVSNDFRYIDTNADVSIVLKPNADANKAWIVDTDGDLYSNAGNATTGSVYGANIIARGDLSGSNLLLTGNATIDGNIVLGGNITIGDESTDTVSFGGEVASDIIPSANNTYDLGATGDVFAEVHATNLYGTVNGVVNATNGIVSQSVQTVAHLLDAATDFGTGRVSGDDFGDVAGTSTFTGSFVGDGSGISGLSTDLTVSGSDGTGDQVALLDGALTFDGGTGVSTTVATDTVTISVQDASTSAKGIASFDSDDFSVTSGNVALKAGDGSSTSGGVRGANLNADTAGDGLSYSLSNQQLDVDYGSTANTAVEGNTTLVASGSANEIEITTSDITLGGGGTIGIRLPEDVTMRNDLTVTNDLSVSGNTTITGNLSVLGSTTTIDSTTVNIGDNILELNIGGAQATAGLQVTDSTGTNTVSGSLIWDGANGADYWKAGPLGSEKELARLNAAPTSNTVLKADANGLLVDSTITDDGTDVSLSGDLTVTGLGAGSNGAFLYADSSNQLVAVDASNDGDVIQWDGSSFVASNELDGGTF